MKRMAFSMTLAQMKARTQTVTRRLGWWDEAHDVPIAPPGTRLAAIERERLDAITLADCTLEGFPDFGPIDFVAFFGKPGHTVGGWPL